MQLLTTAEKGSVGRTFLLLKEINCVEAGFLCMTASCSQDRQYAVEGDNRDEVDPLLNTRCAQEQQSSYRRVSLRCHYTKEAPKQYRYKFQDNGSMGKRFHQLTHTMQYLKVEESKPN